MRELLLLVVFNGLFLVFVMGYYDEFQTILDSSYLEINFPLCGVNNNNYSEPTVHFSFEH
jgi:hypothetical protein